MAFKLNGVVPWGRTRNEYEKMFDLTEADRNKRIIGFGDGPASFNAEMYAMGKHVISLDPIYQFTTAQLQKRIGETCVEVIAQTKANQGNFVWDTIKSVNQLQEIRMGAMTRFLADYELGLAQKRYVAHSLPGKTDFTDNEFELGLCSHFLLLYAGLGLDFHKAAINEMMRICKEVRIFPILTLNGQKPDFLAEFLFFLNKDYQTQIKTVGYEFQKGGNEMLVIVK